LKPTIHSHFVTPLLRHAESKGVQPGKVLEAVGLSSDVINQPLIRFTGDQYSMILRILWKELDDEFFGMSTQAVHFGTLSLFCELALKEKSVGAALQKQAECFKLATNDIRWELRTTCERAFYSLSTDQLSPNTKQIFTEYLLSMTHRFACWLAGEKIPLTRVSFESGKPDYVDEYKMLFGCPCFFGQSMTALEYPEICLSWPNVRTKKELLPLLKSSPAGILVNPVIEKSFILKVRRTLLANRSELCKFPSFERVSDLLGLSSGTLRRRLKAENTSYQTIKDLIRRDIAIELLSDRSKSVFEVACAVGFSEASTFSRAFRAWTGLSPMAYRKQDNDRNGL